MDLRVIQGSKKAPYNVLTNKDAREILQKALALSDNERAELAGNLIASLDTDLDPTRMLCGRPRSLAGGMRLDRAE